MRESRTGSMIILGLILLACAFLGLQTEWLFEQQYSKSQNSAAARERVLRSEGIRKKILGTIRYNCWPMP